MKKLQFTGTMISYKRRKNSDYGNPKYYGIFEAENGDILRGTTGTDASCAYSFLNKQDKNRTVEYHITRTGNVIIDYITVVE